MTYSTWGRSASAVLTVPNDITATENKKTNFVDVIVSLLDNTVQCNSEEGVPLISFILFWPLQRVQGLIFRPEAEHGGGLFHCR